MEEEQKKDNSALNVQKGVDPPSSLNEEAIRRIRSSRQSGQNPEELVQGIKKGDRSALSRAITLVESSRTEHQHAAQEIVEACLPLAGKSVRIGITGVPGVGKSTFIEALGKYLTGSGKRLAVLAIDPSSARTRGSILGDKTRMEELANDENAFIRPSPSAGSLGGVARKTRESIILCEAAGFDIIFVETVGVGQSEIAVHGMVDFFLLLMLSGAGDELQGIKRGIMEMADGIAINKADGDNIPAATRAQAEYSNALHLFPPSESGWTPKVLTCSAISKKGIAEVWNMISEYKAKTRISGYFEQKRKSQNSNIMIESIREKLGEHFFSHPRIKKLLPEMEMAIRENKVSAYVAAQRLMEEYLGSG